jgi:Ser-tRNA(Ala) deacylase AlaX
MQIMKARLESAQHILLRVLMENYQAQQVTYEIYDDRIRLVVKSPQDLALVPKEEIEEQVNQVIGRNLTVTENTYQRDDVPNQIDISLAPTDVEEVRVISIGDFDSQPCHNLHVGNTSEIGAYHLVELKKDGKDTYKLISNVE